jgi:Ca-activated chloride channel family protein
MKPLLFALVPVLLGSTAQAQVAPRFRNRIADTIAERPFISPPLGLAILDGKGEVSSLCALERTEVSSDISGQIARVEVTQHFSNPSNTPIEALYTFPLPHDAAVDGMNFRIGERRIVGEIKKRAEAAQIYQTAKQNGQSAALLDQERPNIFSQRVANILPGQKIEVRISFTQPVVYRGGAYEWEFPTVVGPRFVTPQTPDAEKITPPITPKGTKAGHDLTMQVHLQSAVPLGEVSSALHPINVEREGDRAATISLKDGAALPNRDFILRFAPRDNALQTGLLVRQSPDGSGWFQLVLQPPASPPKAQIAPKEMVFVIDQTGSQMGAPIEKAKETMRYCIQNLNPGDTFQLLGFNTDVYPCFPQPVEATPQNIARALDYLRPLQGGGGTDILKATDYALKMPDDPNRPRIVCFMTDGYVGNEANILSYVRGHRGRARMFPFGVGNGVNRFLIDGMAREGRGTPEYALLGEDGQKLAQRFYDRLANPLLLDVRTDWGALPVTDVFPKVVPDVFESGPVVLTGRFSKPVAGDLVLRGRTGGKQWQRTVRVDFSQSDPNAGSALPGVWARQKIEELSNRAPDEKVSGEGAKDLQEQVTKIALDYHLMSPFTSFVAVEPTVVNVGGQQKTIEIPVEMTDGVSYEGIFGRETFMGVVGLVSLGALKATAGFGGGGGNFNANTGGHAANGIGAGRAPILGNIPMAGKLFRSRGGVAGGLLYDNDLLSLPSLPTPAQLAAMTPAQRIQAIRASKMSEGVEFLAAQTKAKRVSVQLWLSPLADAKTKADFAAKLKALGWTQDAVLTPDKLVLGTISSDKLDALAALDSVGLVDTPHFQ